MAGTALPLFANNAFTPMTLRYLEDFRPGERFETGTMTLTEVIYAFAREFDPSTLPPRSGGGTRFAIRRPDCQWLAHRCSDYGPGGVLRAECRQWSVRLSVEIEVLEVHSSRTQPGSPPRQPLGIEAMHNAVIRTGDLLNAALGSPHCRAMSFKACARAAVSRAITS